MHKTGNTIWVLIVIVIMVVVCIAGGVWWQKTHVDPDASTLKQDTTGGATPQQTLDLFIVALQKGDTQLASHYFYPVGKIQQSAWAKSFDEIKSQGLLDSMVKDLKTEIRTDTNYQDNSGILLKLNTYTNVWKIVSL